MPIIGVPFQRVAVDLVGPIVPASSSGFSYILTVVDYATRFPEAVPLKNIDTKNVAEALFNIFTRVGFPEEILSDQGKQFQSDLMKEINRLLSIKQLRTTPYHPMTNGLVERFNGTLKAMLKRLCIEQPKEWDRFIPAALFAYREAEQDSLGFSPFQLLYGRTVRGPLMILKDLWIGNGISDETRTTYQHVIDLKDKLESMYQLAHNNLECSAKRYKESYDRKAKPRVLEVGEKVLLLLPKKKNKLELQWQGPFEVLEKKGEADYKISVNGDEKFYHKSSEKIF